MTTSESAIHFAPSPRDVVTMRTLGELGRFGNQFFQYAFVRTYARQHDLHYEVPAWIGQSLFGHVDPPISRQLPQFYEKVCHDVDDTFIPHLQSPLRNVDVVGFFQYHTSYYAPHRELIESLFAPIDSIATICRQALKRLKQIGDEVVALHLRRGDYGYSHFFIAPSLWYRGWLADQRGRWKRPVIFVATDDEAAIRREFAGVEMMTQRDLGLGLLPFPDFYLDFYILAQANAVAISNSSFSFAACLLNRTATQFARPVLPAQRLVAFDPWNSKPLLQDATVEEYRHVLGIGRESAAATKPARA